MSLCIDYVVGWSQTIFQQAAQMLQVAQRQQEKIGKPAK
jgi:hypothetical protein